MSDAKAPAVIEAHYAGMVAVPSKNLVRVTLEFDIARMVHFVTMFGAPGDETWVALARLDKPSDAAATVEDAPDASLPDNGRRADSPPKPKRSGKRSRTQRAGILCNDAEFIAWADGYAIRELGGPVPGFEDTPGYATAEIVRVACQVTSRREFDADPDAGKRWDQLLSQYERETHGAPEER